MTVDPEPQAHVAARLREAWAAALGTAPAALEDAGVTRVERDDLDAVVAVAFGAAIVVAAPSAALSALAELPVDALHDADALAAALPGARALGTAHLLCTGARPAPPQHAVVEARSADLTAIGAAMSADEWDEGGVQELERRWAVRDEGVAAAIAGYGHWRGAVAQLGVAAAPARRGRGFARSVAAAAVRAAIDEGLVAQWRCRVGNEPSLALARGLGFAPLGTQSAVALPR